MSGEFIEDLKLETLKLGDVQLDKKYNFIPNRFRGPTYMQDLEAEFLKYYE